MEERHLSANDIELRKINKTIVEALPLLEQVVAEASNFDKTRYALAPSLRTFQDYLQQKRKELEKISYSEAPKLLQP